MSPVVTRQGWFLLWLFVAAPLGLILYKVGFLDYRLGELLPRTEHQVNVGMALDGNLGRVSVRTFVPQTDERQIVRSQEQQSDLNLRFLVESEGLNRVVRWSGTAVPDQAQLEVRYSVLTSAIEYAISPALEVPEGYSESLGVYLRPTAAIQVDDPEIGRTVQLLGADSGTLRERLQKIYQLTSGLRTRAFKGTTDALTALRLQEASCNGKSRLFVALARSAGIPSRLVGGLILADGTKRTSHQWLEAYAGGHWVPFDPTNHHFAELPANYLVLYRGDEALFRHTSDINFDFAFETSSHLVPAPLVTSSNSSLNVWGLFERLGLPFSLLRTVLMLPIGALVVVLFRNVVGMPTFGTFLPALIAGAASETGLGWGLVSVLIVISAVVIARKGIDGLGLLHSPTLGILLAVVVLTMLVTSLVAERLGLASLARVAYFPIAVMAIASERFYLALTEEGAADATKQLLGTLVVVLGCYAVMNSLAMQALVSGFPETLLLVVAANMYLGRWVGVRLLELWRFRSLIERPVAG